MSYNEIGCGACGVKRPRWHGGSHRCLKVGELIHYPHIGSVQVTERELGFLSTPERTSL